MSAQPVQQDLTPGKLKIGVTCIGIPTSIALASFPGDNKQVLNSIPTKLAEISRLDRGVLPLQLVPGRDDNVYHRVISE